MEYFNKYLKYKNKYLELKQQQIGGEVPLISIIRNIQLIEDKCINHYLDPIYGFIYSNNGFIFNYYNFYDDEDKLNLIGKIINKIFDRNLTLTKIIKDDINITPKFIGNVISYLYLLKFHNLKNKLKIDKPNKFNKVKIFCKQKLIDKIENITNSKNKKIREIINIIEICDHVDAFRILLIIMWHKANNKDGIQKYYEGINEIFMYYNELGTTKIKIIDIPNDFLEDKIGTDFQEELILLNSNFHIYYQSSPPNICKVNFPDCGEQAIRNFINMICFNGTFFDINVLKKLNASCKLIEYYTVFNNFSKQSNGDFKIFGKTFTGRTAWNFIVSNLKNVRYNNKPKQCIYDGQPFLYNIDGGLNITNSMPNLFQVIVNLFEGINTFDELISKLIANRLINNVTDYKKNINKNGEGIITFDVKKWKFTIILKLGHYHVECILKSVQSNNYLSENEKNIISTLSKVSDYNIKIDNNFMYNKWTKENIIYIINYKILDKNLYYNIFKYIDKLGFDEKRRIILNFNLIKNITRYDLTEFGVDYTCTDKEKLITSLLYRCNYSPTIELFNKINTLEELSFSDYFNQPLGKSLIPLTSLKKLGLNGSFNKPLGNSLSSLTSLEKLTFDGNFNQPLDNSLITLTSLEKLTFGHSFNQALDYSLCSLTKLKELKFDDYFNKNINCSLKTLTNLQELTFGIHFNNDNLPLEDALSSLINLESLIFSENFNNQYKSLDNSLSSLTKLKKLIFGFNFNNGNKPLDNSLSNLTSLEELTFGGNFNNGDRPLGNSLNKLTSLQKLTFESFTNNIQLYFVIDDISNPPPEKYYGENFDNGREPICDSLRNLINLKQLIFSTKFDNGDTPLGNSLSTLTSLEKLDLGNYKKPLGNLLSSLTKLKELTFGYEFNNGDTPLDYSLSTLTSLEKLNLGNYDKSLGNSLNSLTELKELTFGVNFSQPLGTSLKVLTKLKVLTGNFDKRNIYDYLANHEVEIIDIYEGVYVRY